MNEDIILPYDEVSYRVATEIMGWMRVGDESWCSPRHDVHTISIDGKPSFKTIVKNWDGKGPHPCLISPDGDEYYLCECRGDQGERELPAWTSSITLAWEVANTIDAIMYIESDNFGARVNFVWNENGELRESTSRCHLNPAMAICLAALQAREEMSE